MKLVEKKKQLPSHPIFCVDLHYSGIGQTSLTWTLGVRRHQIILQQKYKKCLATCFECQTNSPLTFELAMINKTIQDIYG